MLGNDKHRPCIHDEFQRIPNSSGRGQRVGNGRLTMRENKGSRLLLRSVQIQNKCITL